MLKEKFLINKTFQLTTVIESTATAKPNLSATESCNLAFLGSQDEQHNVIKIVVAKYSKKNTCTVVSSGRGTVLHTPAPTVYIMRKLLL